MADVSHQKKKTKKRADKHCFDFESQLKSLEPSTASSLDVNDCASVAIGSETKLSEKYASLPLGDLLALKDELGTKEYERQLFGQNRSNADASARKDRKIFKRLKKKGPAEVSSKIAVSKLRNVFEDTSAREKRRDPRFDASNEFNEQAFRKHYGFLDEIVHSEQTELKKSLKAEKDVERKQQLKQALVKLKSSEALAEKRAARKEMLRNLRKSNEERLKQGLKPIYVRRSEIKKAELAATFEKLKATPGKLEKYMAKKRKKEAKKQAVPFATK